MNNNYIKHPKNVIQLGEELRKIINNYWEGDEKEPILREYVYSINNNKLLFEENGEMNKTVKKIIGAKRYKLVMKLLETR